MIDVMASVNVIDVDGNVVSVPIEHVEKAHKEIQAVVDNVHTRMLADGFADMVYKMIIANGAPMTRCEVFSENDSRKPVEFFYKRSADALFIDGVCVVSNVVGDKEDDFTRLVVMSKLRPTMQNLAGRQYTSVRASYFFGYEGSSANNN